MFLIVFFEGIITTVKYTVNSDLQGICFIAFESCTDAVEM